MGNTFYFQWEVNLMEAIQKGMSPVFEKIASFLSLLGTEYFIVAVVGFVLWSYDKETGKKIGRTLMMSLVWFGYIKNIALRRRPYFDHPGIKCLAPVDSSADIYDITAQGYSFPSGHSANSAVAYGSLAYHFKNKTVKAIGIALPVLIGISRFCVGVHYPTDVLCGWILGLVLIFGMDFIFKKVKNKAIVYLILYLVSFTGCFFCHTTDYFTGLGMMGGFFLGDLYEEKYVKYENATTKKGAVIRLLLGCGIFLGLNVVLKLPFPKEILEQASALSFGIRIVRYTVTLFVIVGLYPRLFKKLKI